MSVTDETLDMLPQMLEAYEVLSIQSDIMQGLKIHIRKAPALEGSGPGFEIQDQHGSRIIAYYAEPLVGKTDEEVEDSGMIDLFVASFSPVLQEMFADFISNHAKGQ